MQSNSRNISAGEDAGLNANVAGQVPDASCRHHDDTVPGKPGTITGKGGTSLRSRAGSLHAPMFIAFLLVALALAGWAGAVWQEWRYKVTGQISMAPSQTDTTNTANHEPAMAGSLKVLSDKLGELQARVLAIEALRARISEAAGLDHDAAGTDSGLELLGPEHPDAGHGLAVTGELSMLMHEPGLPGVRELGQGIAHLWQRLETQEDAYAMVDAALARQAGFQASLPTFSPLDAPALSSTFGWRRNPVNGRQRMHEGLDFAAPRGAPIYAASGGLVVRAGVMRGYGRMVEIDHGNGLRTRYAHASSLLVKAGDIVLQGQQIARVGRSGLATGDHLHFEVRMADYPLDPSLFMGAYADSMPARSGDELALLLDDADAQGTRLR